MTTTRGVDYNVYNLNEIVLQKRSEKLSHDGPSTNVLLRKMYIIVQKPLSAGAAQMATTEQIQLLCYEIYCLEMTNMCLIISTITWWFFAVQSKLLGLIECNECTLCGKY